MTEVLRVPREDDARKVARLTNETWPEPIDEAIVLLDWSTAGVQLERDARLGRDSYALVESLGDERVWRPFRGRGLGRGLLLHSFAEPCRHGLTRAGLGVDAESLTGAHRLYEAVGMHVSARFAIHEKVVC